MTEQTHRVAAGQLLQYIEQWEKAEVEKKDIAKHQREIMATAKANGYDPARIKDVIKLRAMDADERAEREAVTALYSEAVGL
jgi:uncharacterized protein (UPF0335 family)